jgi:biopolymer transport protein ExbD
VKFSRPPEEDVSINLTPLIDIVFLLLIFFIVSTTFSRETELEIALPEATRSSALNSERAIIALEIDTQGHYRLRAGQGVEAGSGLLDTQSLHASLRRLSQGPQMPTLIIHADTQASHGSVVSALDAARRAGLTRITFAAQVKP